MIFKKLKKSAAVLSLLLAFTVAFTAAAGALNQFLGYADYTATSGVPAPPEIDSGAAIVIEVNSGTIMYAKNAFTHYTAASTQKILTALVAVENCDLDDMVTFSAKAIEDIEDGGHNYDVVAGETMSLRSCLEIMLVASMNEAAYAIAEHVAGSVQEFAKLMNARAKACGARDSNFVTPNGLNGDGQYTNAYDMAMIIAECAKNPIVAELASLTECTVTDAAKREGGYQYTSHNKILCPDSEYYKDYILFGKTGYTALSKNTLVSFASNGEVDLACVILRAPGAEATYNDTAALCQFVFDSVGLCDIGDLMLAALQTELGDCTAEFSNSTIVLPERCTVSDVTCTATVSENRDNAASGEILINMNGTQFTRGFTATVTPPPAADPPVVSAGTMEAPPAQDDTPATPPAADTPEPPAEDDPQLSGEVTDGEKKSGVLRWVIIVAAVLIVLFAGYILLLKFVDKQVKKRTSAYDVRYAQLRAQREMRK